MQQLTPTQTDSNIELDQSDPYGQSQEAPRWITNPFDELDFNTSPTPSSAAPVGMSKFQQQMSGAWNQRIMEGNDSPSWDGQLAESISTSSDKEMVVDAMPMDIAATDELTAEQFLQRIDADYQQLRAKIVAFVNQQNAAVNVDAGPSHLESKLSLNEALDDYSDTEVGMQRSYWPSKNWKKKSQRSEQ